MRIAVLKAQHTCPKAHHVRNKCQHIAMGDVTSTRKLPKIELHACEGALCFARGGLRAAGVDVNQTDNRIVKVFTKRDARMARHRTGKEGAREETGTWLEEVLRTFDEEPLAVKHVARARQLVVGV